METNKIGKLSAEEVAAAAYSQFGIVADDQEITDFARWVLEQGAHEKLVQVAKAVGDRKVDEFVVLRARMVLQEIDRVRA